jgi:hypothetical protein
MEVKKCGVQNFRNHTNFISNWKVFLTVIDHKIDDVM